MVTRAVPRARWTIVWLNRWRDSKPASGAQLALLVPALIAASGCGTKLTAVLVPNAPPEVRITEAPVARDSLNPSYYYTTVRWTGFDPDGRVDQFFYAVDPMSVDRIDSTWVSTRASEATFFFEATTPRLPIDPRNPTAISPHTLAIHAVDNKGARSPVAAAISFFAGTIAPVVTVLEPRPTTAILPKVPSTLRITWSGVDPDRPAHPERLVRYVHRLFGAINPDFPHIRNFVDWAQLYPDSLRRVYAPDFAGWTHVGGDTTVVQFRSLVIGSTYMFVVTGFDEAGAYDPVFSTGRNMLKFEVVTASAASPVITMFNQYFSYTYPLGGYETGPLREFRLEVPAGQPVNINWFATTHTGADMRRYRWVMDLVDLDDNAPRSNEHTDWYHWSAWSLNTTSATVGPFWTNQEEHLFCIEAEDNSGLKSLGIVRFRIVRPTFDRGLLFVDDTRLTSDLRSGPLGGPVDAPAGPWPTAAELDTFLYARGGYPWKSYPAGVLSPPGILNGYAFDTLGTRGIVGGQVPLSLLGQYRFVVWYVDEAGATFSQPPTSTGSPITALRLSSQPNRPPGLATYISMGGRVWLAGGGAAAATLFDWNRVGTTPFEYSTSDGEVVEGRLMYDYAYWRSSIQMLPAIQARRFGTTSFGTGPRPGRGWLGQPDYAALPPTLQLRNPATDPPPPLRQADSYYYPSAYNAEYLNRSNLIREDDDPDSATVHEVSVLDTLYLTSGGTALANGPLMTYYHGSDSPPLVFSGFGLWHWRRPQCIALFDFVLGQLWGLPRDGTSPRTGPSALASPRRASR